MYRAPLHPFSARYTWWSFKRCTGTRATVIPLSQKKLWGCRRGTLILPPLEMERGFLYFLRVKDNLLGGQKRFSGAASRLLRHNKPSGCAGHVTLVTRVCGHWDTRGTRKVAESSTTFSIAFWSVDVDWKDPRKHGFLRSLVCIPWLC